MGRTYLALALLLLGGCSALLPLAGPDGTGTTDARSDGAASDAGADAAADGLLGDSAALDAIPDGSARDVATADGPAPDSAGPDAGPVVQQPICNAAGWCWENPLPQGNTLNGAWYGGPSDITLVGDAGTILHYDGSVWTRQESGTTQQLTAIWGDGSGTRFVVGTGGTWLRKAGSGPWTALQGSTAGTWLRGVWGTAANDVYAVGNGGAILHFNGSAYSARPSAPTAVLHGVWGTGTDLYAAGQDGVYYSTDKFQTHNSVLTAAGTTWRAISGDGSRVVAVGSTSAGAAAAISNGGGWTVIGAPLGAAYLDAVWCNAAHCAALSPSKLHKLDVLNGWTTSGIQGDLHCIHGDAAGTGFVAAGVAGMTHIHEMGKLTTLSSGWTGDLQDVWGAGGTALYVVGNSERILQRASNGSWSTVHTGAYGLRGVSGSDPNDVATVGLGGTMLTHTAAGWTPQAAVTASGLNDVWIGSGVGYAVGNSGTLLTRTGAGAWVAGGGSWPNTLNLRSVWALPSLEVVIATSVGSVWRQKPMATSWTEQTVAGTSLNGIWGTAASDLYVVGNLGALWHWDGSSWTTGATLTSADLLGIYGRSTTGATEVYVVGEDGTLLSSAGGWQVLPAGTGNHLRGVWAGANGVWVVGQLGTVLRHK